MAEKRMFTMKIVDSDAFLDMPMSTQALYFHLNMRADDDGFINNPKKICRYIGCSEDDLKLLIAKRFVLTFETGVIVIKHWRMHNILRKDRYNPTQYEDEFASLELKANGSYTEKDGCQVVAERLPSGCQVVAETAPQVSIDKVSIDKVSSSTVDPDAIHTQIEWEILTTTAYDRLTKHYGVKLVDEIIQKIKDNNYHGCLNEEKISQWCEERNLRAKNVKHYQKHGFKGRDYDQTIDDLLVDNYEE